jgi:DNA polymerase III subunit gamma/tau
MADVLYRKYRSKSFSELVGQDTTVSVLREAIKQERIAHAYLFSGPRGTGKTSAARIFSKAINCERFHEKGDVCNECDNCIAINNAQTQDILEMDAASNRKVDDIRDLKNNIDYLPTQLKRRIIIIDEAHMLTNEAFNALLKTLEEPPEHIIFIFATTEAHKMPITILSRVQRFDFRLGNKDAIVSKLSNIAKSEEVEVDPEALALVYKKSGGSFRDSESLLGKILNSTSSNKVGLRDVQEILGMMSESELVQYLDMLVSGDVVTFLNKVNNQIDSGLDLSYLIENLLEKSRDILLETYSTDKQKYLRVMKVVGSLIKAKKDSREFTDKKLVLEIYLSELLADSSLTVDSVPQKPVEKAVMKAAPKKEEKEENKVTTDTTPDPVAVSKADGSMLVNVEVDSNVVPQEYTHDAFSDIVFSMNRSIGSFVDTSRTAYNGETLTIFVESALKHRKLTEIPNLILIRQALGRMGLAVNDILVVIESGMETEISAVAEVSEVRVEVQSVSPAINDNSTLVEGLF